MGNRKQLEGGEKEGNYLCQNQRAGRCGARASLLLRRFGRRSIPIRQQVARGGAWANSNARDAPVRAGAVA